MFSFLFLHQVYSRSHRVLFVTDSSKDIKSYSQFIEDLESIGCVITQELTSHEEIHLQRFGEKLYDTIIIAGGNSHCFGKKIENLIEFIDEGGNAIIFHGNQSNDIQDLLYANLSIKYQKSQIMSDIFENSSVILRRFVAPRLFLKIRVLLFIGEVFAKFHAPMNLDFQFIQVMSNTVFLKLLDL